jgi:ABC-type transport system substrate-binding protein
MKRFRGFRALTVAIAWLGVALAATPAAPQETPRRGGALAYSVLAEPPSFDAHQEATFAVPHTTAPFYSLLVKLDANEYPKVVPDLAANCFRYGLYRLLGRTQKAYKTEGRIMKCCGYLAGKLRSRQAIASRSEP